MKIITRKTSGRGVGSQIGFPTLNFLAPAKLPQGVFAGRLNGLPAVIFCGKRKSFDKVFALEVHLLDFQAKAFTQAEITFGAKIREIQQFTKITELQKQIRKDCAKAKALLAV